MTHIRLKPKERKKDIITAALKVAEDSNYLTLTCQNIAAEAGCARSSVIHYFGTMVQLRRSIIRAAIKEENLTVIAQGLVSNDKHALKANKKLKIKALQACIGE